MPERKIEKIDHADIVPREELIGKLNELIDAFNNHWHEQGDTHFNTYYPTFWGQNEPRNEVAPNV